MQKKKNFRPKIFIQVNIGNEIQKNGIELEQLDAFTENCKNNLDLNIVGLMCIPPENKTSTIYFSKMNELKNKLKLDQLSMGMSNDYLVAVDHGATFVRVGSDIFGKRS